MKIRAVLLATLSVIAAPFLQADSKVTPDSSQFAAAIEKILK